MHKIEIKNLFLIFGDKKTEAKNLMLKGKNKEEILAKTGCTVAVNNASFNIDDGEIFVIMGLSGSGKSTLLRCLNRLIEPTEGEIFIDSQKITELNEKELLKIRQKKMSMVFQHFGLLPHRTVASNAGFGLEIQKVDPEKRKEKALKSLEIVGLKGYENMMTSELSGGMQQRVGLARALANDPEILLMDEAFSALDPLIRNQMQDELLSIQEKMKKTIIFITHDLDEAIKIGNRIAIMKDGYIVQIGTPEEILTNPADNYVESFVEKVDRKTIITASSLMCVNPTKLRVSHDGTEMAIRKMRELSTNILPVISSQNHFEGFVYIDDILKLKKEGEHKIDKAVKSKIPSVYPEATVEEMLPLIKEESWPIGVVDKNNKLLVIVSQTSIIIETTGKNENEVNQILEKAIEL